MRNSNSFDYKAKIVGTLADGELEKQDVTIAMPLKYLGNFWRSLDIPLINCEITLILSWYEKCVLVGKALGNAPDPQPNPPKTAIESPSDAKFEITDCKLYVPVVNLSAENDKRSIKWNKDIPQISNQNKNNNLNYLIDPTFSNVNRLFVLPFKNEDGRTSYYKYYVPSV